MQTSSEELDKKVNRYLKDGYKLFGYPIVTVDKNALYIFQAMVKAPLF